MNAVRALILSSFLAGSLAAFEPPALPPPPAGLSALDGLKVKRIVDALVSGDETKALQRWGKLIERKGPALGEGGRRALAKHIAHAVAGTA